MVNSTQVFRSSFWKLWRWTTTFCGIFYCAALLGGTRLELAPAAMITLFIAAIFTVAIICFPVYVSRDGIRCYNYFGVYFTVPWDRISNITRFHVFGLHYLKINSYSEWSSITIPLYLANMPRFIEAVQQNAGENHPLTQALKQSSP